MAYKFIPLSIEAGAQKGADPKAQYVELFQQTLNEQFYNASNWWTIKQELISGTEVYTDIDVRISHVINAETGLKMGDDWKTLFFNDVSSPQVGRRYNFDDNIWLTINTEKIKNLTGTATIRRCNNTMRWIDEATGVYYEEPCCIEYLVKEPRNYATAGSPFMTPGGFLHADMQFNANSNLISENQRFLFGNEGHWTCYKVIGTGLNDFKNEKTYDNTSVKILTVDLVADYVNYELDDVVNGIANVNKNVYTISLNQNTAEGSIGDTVQLSASITYNGKSATRSVVWSTSDADIATVDASGLVTLIDTGACVITGTIDGNPAHDECDITVTTTPADNEFILIAPDKNYILEGKSQIYSVYLYVNDVQQADAFTFVCNPNGVPSANYAFEQLSGNTFSVSNILRDPSSFLTITCTSGTHVKTYNIVLRGAW